MNRFVYPTSVAVALVLANFIQASEETIGPKGINSAATGLNGMNSSIGQVEPGRPGKTGRDTEADCCNNQVVPIEVYTRDAVADANQGLNNEHALWVASIMISKQDTLGLPGGLSKPLGVAPEARLVSAAFRTDQPLVNLQEDAALAAQTIKNFSFATNMSFGVPDGGFDLDGTSTLTSFVDWSTVSQEVLYVVAGNEIGEAGAVPTDNFNGITVAASTMVSDGFFRKVSVVNVFDEALDAVGQRTSTLILAPGQFVDVAGPNGSQPAPKDGTSYAAPHVTGTLALLQQRASTTNGNRHLTKKAVVLNSADKIKGIIGMERTVLKGTTDWFGTDAHNDPAIPVDREMGVGHLNANRAVQQLDGGEHGPGGVPLIGWDYALQDDPFIPNKYTLTLNEGDFVAATLVWDRDVFLNSPFLEYQRGDEFIDFGFANLDLFLVPAGLGMEQAVASSTSTAWNLEHIFAKVTDPGNYEIWVTTSEMNAIPYALAWWAGADARIPGDYNGNGSVDAPDYVVWRNGGPLENEVATIGTVTQEDYNEWRARFGNTAGAGSGSGSSAAVPEPSTVALMFLGVLFWCAKSTRRLLA